MSELDIFTAAGDGLTVEQLPGKAKFGGYVYLVEFDNGTVKVGSTANPKARFETFRRDAHAFGLSIVRTWLSVLHDDYQRNEEKLLGLAAERGTSRDGREYFTGTTLADLRALAIKLDFPPVDLAAHEAREARSRENARAIFGVLTEVSVGESEDPLYPFHRAIGPFFGWDRRTGTRSFGEVTWGEPVPMELVKRIAERDDMSIDEVMDLDYIDLLERLVTATVRTEALRLRAYALESGRRDLTKKLRDTA